MTQTYKSQIIKTFRDQAVKSVLLVDDDFSPYEVLAEEYSDLLKDIEALTNVKEDRAPEEGQHEQQLTELKTQLTGINTRLSSGLDKFKQSDLAQEFTKFFHNTKRICDVEDKTDNLDYEKIRKSDLIILDYHLEPGTSTPAAPSLKLISELSDSKHLNMVVIFTKEPLDDVWLEVATILRGSHQGPPANYLLKAAKRLWNTNETNWLACWEMVFTKEEKVSYLSQGNNFAALNNSMAEQCRLANHPRPKSEHIQLLIEISLSNHNLIDSDSPENQVEVHGENGLWVQAGDVFIVLCDKFKDRTSEPKTPATPLDVWERIEVALLDWYPSFYRVVTSQLQNQIEDANLSMKKALAKDQIEQTAALWGIHRNPDGCYNEAAKDLLANLLDDIFYKLQDEDDFISFIATTAKKAKDEPNSHINSTTNKRETQLHIAHAYNAQLSSTQDFPSYITTGTIVKDENECWYLCVTPSCNTVPTQKVIDFTPHRQLTFAKLRLEKDLSKALITAHKSTNIFVLCPKEGRLAFSTLKTDKDEIPNLIKVVVMNHDNGQWDDGNLKRVTITKTKTILGKPVLEFIEREFTPISRLRPAYAARFQNLQSHYEGRIGVDFVSFDINKNPITPEILAPEPDVIQDAPVALEAALE